MAKCVASFPIKPWCMGGVSYGGVGMGDQHQGLEQGVCVAADRSLGCQIEPPKFLACLDMKLGVQTIGC